MTRYLGRKYFFNVIVTINNLTVKPNHKLTINHRTSERNKEIYIYIIYLDIRIIYLLLKFINSSVKFRDCVFFFK